MKKKPVALAAILLVLGGFLLYKYFTRPLPGVAVADLGRAHTDDIFGVEYNSNPPTSGKHFPIWAKRGVYDRVLSDGYLIHSLEHGYIVISYNCTKPISSNFNLIRQVLAHEDDKVKTGTNSATPLMHMNFEVQTGTSINAFSLETAPKTEVELPKEFESAECKDRISKLSVFLNDFDRIVIVPRVNLDVPIALTAWGRILKLNNFDERQMREFISSFHNRGPEATTE